MSIITKAVCGLSFYHTDTCVKNIIIASTLECIIVLYKVINSILFQLELPKNFTPISYPSTQV